MSNRYIKKLGVLKDYFILRTSIPYRRICLCVQRKRDVLVCVWRETERELNKKYYLNYIKIVFLKIVFKLNKKIFIIFTIFRSDYLTQIFIE